MFTIRIAVGFLRSASSGICLRRSSAGCICQIGNGMKSRKIESSIVAPDMTPVIDVVFQLLMLFMIAINFENTKADERSRLPRDMLAKPPEIRPEHELVLNLGYKRGADGSKMDRTPTVVYNNRDVPISQLGPGLEQERRELELRHGRKVVDDVTVLIRAEADVSAGFVQELVQKCQQYGFKKFLLRATPDVK